MPITDLTAENIAEYGGVTAAYARMLIAGTRYPSLELALRLYDRMGGKYGPLEGLADDEIAAVRKLAKVA